MVGADGARETRPSAQLQLQLVSSTPTDATPRTRIRSARGNKERGMPDSEVAGCSVLLSDILVFVVNSVGVGSGFCSGSSAYQKQRSSNAILASTLSFASLRHPPSVSSNTATSFPLDRTSNILSYIHLRLRFSKTSMAGIYCPTPLM